MKFYLFLCVLLAAMESDHALSGLDYVCIFIYTMGSMFYETDHTLLARVKRVIGFENGVTPRPELRAATYELLNRVREPSAQERAALEKQGFIFLSVEAKSFAQVIAENPDHISPHESDYARQSADLRDYKPPKMTVAVSLRHHAIRESMSIEQNMQLALVEKYSKTTIEKKVPGAKAIIMPASVYAQLDMDYQTKTGKVLLRGFYARTLNDDEESPNIAGVGRGSEMTDGLLRTRGFSGFSPSTHIKYVDSEILAVPAIVFIHPLS